MAKKVKDPADPGPDVSLYLIYIGFAVLGTVWLALHLGNHMSATKQDIPINPIAIVAGLARGKFEWPTASTVILIAVVLAVIAYVMVRKRLKKNKGKGKLPVDDKAQYMGNGGAISSLTEAGVRAKAEQLGVRLGYDDSPGVPIGISVADGIPLYGSYEDLHLDIWGPRQGKTTSRVIPAILTAVGPVVATSNKRDVVDATRDVRESKGSRTFVFDPQGVAGEHPTWFWDPLKWVDAPRDGCEMRASRLAGHFADGDDGSDETRDAYFDPEAEDLLAGLFLAASVSNFPITRVWDWVTDPNNGEPVEILRRAAGYYGVDGLNFTASGLAQQYNAEARTKSGIFGTAKKMVRCLKLSNVHPWVTRGADSRYEFDELEFLDSNSTLYCLSLEGRGSAGPLVSALTEAVVERAMYKASQSRGGRLPIPLIAVLDEAANIVRWKDLPKQYSHFGSRGIVVMTVLQSWAQGVRCWGEAGMEALWAAANVKVLGSGIDDIKFLTARSEAIGDYDSISASVSESKGGKSYSKSLGSSRTLNVNALVTLPRGRAVVFSSGAPATLVRVVPWWEGEYADEVRRSIEHHDPQRQRTTVDDLIESRGATDIAAPDSTTTYGQPEEVRPL
ncbi:type IV secretory pathway TraG/TraD family ATPase VirD4 [Nocardia transvalensis]|uniref:Type IV secretory pathway TraG/TraD family ATPase VirD4 n=1 Tax=Nocardia transvalensis TaxID=37333 RepID=A0A7W9PHE9_9NOCA|nr:type IV secretory system conjugative DNA transfer family protein [Nocardia transvalensis]MBB5915763.1 type IV secretory pathway TraG/TraD family ATPase VirD4 [Nocardia transvalensis]